MEATRGVLQRALVAAQLPTLQHISVIGLVTIPPMMNGEVLSGTPASQVETTSSCRGTTHAAQTKSKILVCNGNAWLGLLTNAQPVACTGSY